MNDLMRLPLGILTGVGYIGGGAILRRGSIVVGVTTAATLWLVTVIGLCIGGGQFGLGLVATVLGLLALWVLQWIEDRLAREQPGRLSIEIDATGAGEAEIRRRLIAAGLSIAGFRIAHDAAGHRKLAFDVRELRRPTDMAMPNVVQELAREPGVIKLKWRRNSGAAP
jgi:putative Mg2+ transporter-C (MgtC) family protein